MKNNQDFLNDYLNAQRGTGGKSDNHDIQFEKLMKHSKQKLKKLHKDSLSDQSSFPFFSINDHLLWPFVSFYKHFPRMSTIFISLTAITAFLGMSLPGFFNSNSSINRMPLKIWKSHELDSECNTNTVLDMQDESPIETSIETPVETPSKTPFASNERVEDLSSSKEEIAKSQKNESQSSHLLKHEEENSTANEKFEDGSAEQEILSNQKISIGIPTELEKGINDKPEVQKVIEVHVDNSIYSSEAFSMPDVAYASVGGYVEEHSKLYGKKESDARKVSDSNDRNEEEVSNRGKFSMLYDSAMEHTSKFIKFLKGENKNAEQSRAGNEVPQGKGIKDEIPISILNDSLHIPDMSSLVVIGRNDIQPGECLALTGFPSYVSVLLSKRSHVRAVSVGGMPRNLSLNPTTAPRHVKAECLCREYREEQSDPSPIPVGRCAPRVDNSDLLNSTAQLKLSRVYPKIVEYSEQIASGEFDMPQRYYATFYSAEEKGTKMKCDAVRFSIESNYGNNEYTCLYRVKVHPPAISEA
ncbi:putative SUN domain-containing protein 1/2 [Monocercomonoides exilis]|uniref:putative SUN domain-containing protein 1/2 n=1 Tax=Monocercomonoides exilis TaxID=2049356 RepID=UPI003559E8E8|nr:putative SUN domain-containing protein 1/2 [Monocercomonoides exilis]|eukprot:MONOS_1428.1-p1 / transcript=MONOS_1428.1 / gene=MONOS_1428 / organism=Monocercomonoides_exilis_PA203 / gene_product=unspecified product / transcript_product=unspecified product / location=Mono_scaffold00025:119415-121521(-) / protein_length=526 / sequence_SO=supercontig / SO=protein_coding / is_pseudo=false